MATNSTKYICKLCKNNLLTQQCLDIHLRICGKPKTLIVCDLCDQTFPSTAQLLSHRYRCNKFICHRCDHAFVNTQAFDFHIRTQHPRSDRLFNNHYKCSICQHLCNSRSDLYSHRLNQHGGADQANDIPEYILNHPNQPL